MKPNPTIGKCPCPVTGCTLVMDVKRVQSRTDDASRQRKAGILYADCKAHGRFGFDGAQAMQDYITENSTKCDESGNASAPAAPKEHSEPAPAATKAREPSPALPPQKTAVPSAPKKSRGLLDW